MYSNIFDTHAHYDDEKFNGDRAEVLSFVRANGVSRIVDCGCDYKSSLAAVGLSDQYDFVYAAVGVHAHEAQEATENDFSQIRKLYSHKKVVAVGEIGLDYHYDFSPRERQLEVFARQLVLANELNLPVIIHDREAHEDTLALLQKHRPKGVVHCFSGSVESAKQIIRLGLYIGLGGAVTFKNAKKPVEVAQFVPEDRLLLETDCPYMAPVPFRGKRCDSSMIASTAERIAAVRNTDTQDLINRCHENARTLFGI